MPLTLSHAGVGLRLKPQELFRRLHESCHHHDHHDHPHPVGGKRLRCLPLIGYTKHTDDAVERLSHDVVELDAQCEQACGHHPRAENLSKLSEDVQKQLRNILDIIKDLTANKSEKGDRRECQRHISAEEGVDLLEKFITADLPVLLLAELPVLEFEARKDVMNVCSALLWPDMPQHVDQEVLQYFRNHHRLVPLLVEGYKSEPSRGSIRRRPQAALNYGVVLRSCARHKEMVEVFLQHRVVFDLISFAQLPCIDLSSDAFYSLREVLLEHRDVSGAWLAEHYTEFFEQYNKLLQSDDYVLARQALTLLTNMLLDRSFKRVMRLYVSDEANLMIHMNFLRDGSQRIQDEAFHVFKVFVMNPNMPSRVHQILFQNKEKLVRLLELLETQRPEDKQFAKDQRTVAERLQALPPPSRALSRKGSSISGKGDSPTRTVSNATSSVLSACALTSAEDGGSPGNQSRLMVARALPRPA